MRRKYNADQAMASIERLRAVLPNVKFTTDVIVGFPGESEEDFEASCDFARRPFIPALMPSVRPDQAQNVPSMCTSGDLCPFVLNVGI